MPHGGCSALHGVNPIFFLGKKKEHNEHLTSQKSLYVLKIKKYRRKGTLHLSNKSDNMNNQEGKHTNATDDVSNETHCKVNDSEITSSNDSASAINNMLLFYAIMQSWKNCN